MVLDDSAHSATLLVTKALAEKLSADGFHRRRFINSPIIGETSPVTFFKDAELEQNSNMPDGGNFVTMGAFSYSFTPNLIQGMRIGRYCSIADGLNVFTMQHPMTGISTNPFIYDANETSVASELASRKVTDYPFLTAPQKPAPIIENDVWIGMNVTLARGIRIGTGAIIGAGSVVTKYVPPYTVVGGNPAKIIRRRFDDELCDQMLASRWWDYNFVDFRHMEIGDPRTFLAQFEYVKKNSGLTPLAPSRLSWEKFLSYL